MAIALSAHVAPAAKEAGSGAGSVAGNPASAFRQTLDSLPRPEVHPANDQQPKSKAERRPQKASQACPAPAIPTVPVQPVDPPFVSAQSVGLFAEGREVQSAEQAGTPGAPYASSPDRPVPAEAPVQNIANGPNRILPGVDVNVLPDVRSSYVPSQPVPENALPQKVVDSPLLQTAADPRLKSEKQTPLPEPSSGDKKSSSSVELPPRAEDPAAPAPVLPVQALSSAAPLSGISAGQGNMSGISGEADTGGGSTGGLRSPGRIEPGVAGQAGQLSAPANGDLASSAAPAGAGRSSLPPVSANTIEQALSSIATPAGRMGPLKAGQPDAAAALKSLNPASFVEARNSTDGSAAAVHGKSTPVAPGPSGHGAANSGSHRGDSGGDSGGSSANQQPSATLSLAAGAAAAPFGGSPSSQSHAQPQAAAPASPNSSNASAASPAAHAMNAQPVPAAVQMQETIHTARLIHSLQESEMRVGLHSSEFGSISISTSARRDAVSAQISLDHPELAKAIADNIPQIHETLGPNQHLEIRIAMNGQSGAGFDSRSGGSNGNPQQAWRAGQARAGPGPVSSREGAFIASEPRGWIADNSNSSRLDVRI